MRSILRRRWLWLLAILVLIAVGCSQLSDSVKPTTDKVYTGAQVRAMFPTLNGVLLADETYAEVNPEYAQSWHDTTGRVMSFLGMSAQWSQTFDCNRFVNVKLAVIHVRYLVNTWHARKPSQSAAAGEVWYVAQGTGGLRGSHATVVTIEAGKPVFRDVYSSRVLPLTQDEIATINLIKF